MFASAKCLECAFFS